MGVRRDLHSGLVGDVVGSVVVDEGPGTHHAAAEVGQQAADLGALAELDAPGGEKLTDGLGDDEAAPSADGGRGLAIEIAHSSQPIPVGTWSTGSHARILVECSTIVRCCHG